MRRLWSYACSDYIPLLKSSFCVYFGLDPQSIDCVFFIINSFIFLFCSFLVLFWMVSKWNIEIELSWIDKLKRTQNNNINISFLSHNVICYLVCWVSNQIIAITHYNCVLTLTFGIINSIAIELQFKFYCRC